jgi:hypothetical protein
MAPSLGLGSLQPAQVLARQQKILKAGLPWSQSFFRFHGYCSIGLLGFLAEEVERRVRQ